MEQDVKANGYQMSPMQGVQLLCVADLLRRGQLEICGEDQEDADRALAAILEAAQEIALQWEMTDTPSIKIGDYIKARFWLGEAIWAKVTSIAGGSVDAVLANEPASPAERPDGWRNPLAIGSPVSCGVDDILGHIPKEQP